MVGPTTTRCWGDGADTLLGEAGQDTLEGGVGDDVLRGGADADVFVFNPGAGVDTIADFEDGVDLLDISAFSGPLSIGFSASGTDAEVRINGTLIATLENTDVSDLSAADFIF